MSDAPTPTALRQEMVTILAGASGEPKAQWDACLSELVHMTLSLSPATNWRVALKRRTPADERAVDHAVRLLRAEHPYAAW